MIMETGAYRIRDKAAAVRNVQRALYLLSQISEGDADLRVAPDGFYGAQTAAAVSAFQARRGLAITGTVDLITFTHLIRERERALATLRATNVLSAPMQVGDDTWQISTLHLLLSQLAIDYPDLPPFPMGSRYTAETEAAVQFMRARFCQPGSGTDALLMQRLLLEVEARTVFRPGVSDKIRS